MMQKNDERGIATQRQRKTINKLYLPNGCK